MAQLNVSRETSWKQDDLLQLEITGYTSAGLGVGRCQGRVIFVQGAIAGELVTARLTKVGRNGVWAVVKTVDRPSPHRVEPACPYFGACGGCVFWHMDYAAELEAKAQRVRDALERLGGVKLPALPIHGAPELTGYRNKAQYPVGSVRGRAVAGFFRQKTHRIIPVRRCGIQPETADRAVGAVLEWMDAWHVPAYDEASRTGLVRHIHLRTAMATNQTLLCLVINGDTIPAPEDLVRRVRAAAPQICSVSLSVNRGAGNTVLGSQFIPVYGPMYVEDILCGFRFRISPASFYQVNAAQAERLYRRAAELAQLKKTDTVLELYCGVGTITLALSAYAGQVIGVELNPAAVEDAQANAARNGVKNAVFHCADAGQAASRLAAEGVRPDVVVVDPPRKGLDAAVIAAIAVMAPEKLLYISCDPATLARDVSLLREQGYALSSAEAFDLFPRTAHVETVVLMSRKDK